MRWRDSGITSQKRFRSVPGPVSFRDRASNQEFVQLVHGFKVGAKAVSFVQAGNPDSLDTVRLWQAGGDLSHHFAKGSASYFVVFPCPIKIGQEKVLDFPARLQRP